VKNTEVTLATGAVIVFASAVATLVRLYDPPVKVDAGLIISTFVYGLIAAIITAWAGAEAGLSIASAGGFAVVAGAAVGGMATVKAFLARAGAV
jgi:hypothetical protein